MRTEDALRDALRREAARHTVNPALPAATLVKARVARATAALVAVATAGALVFGGATVLGATRDGGRSGPAPAGGDQPAEPQTEGSPLLLVGQQGWRVSRADQQSATTGEMTFTNGERELELTWRPASDHDMFVEDRALDAAETWDVEIARRDGVLFRYEGTTDFTAMWVDGDLSLELRGVFPDVDAYRAVAQTLGRVDEETWLAALPGDVVTPAERPATVDEMLRDIPVQPAIRIARLKESRVVSDRYQLGARVTAEAACAWIRAWIDARSSGDEARAREAVEAMATSRDWAILEEMEPQGGWSEVVWEYADAMAGEGEVPGGGPMTVAGSYEDSLGCRS